MRAASAAATILLALLAVPAASAAATLPKEICQPGQVGVCHWYTSNGNHCVYTHFGTMWAGACTTSDPAAPVAVCTTIQTGLWDGWCWQGGGVVDNLVAEAERWVDELVP
jgi:hypothetical protein